MSDFYNITSIYSNGTKHPHKNDVPSATTFTIPPIAFLF